MSEWFRDLCNSLPASRSQLFQSCIGLVRIDVNVTRFLLPYVVEQVLLYGSLEDHQHILYGIKLAYFLFFT